MRVTVLICLVACASCGGNDDGGLLLVDVRTSLVPGVDFQRVRTAVHPFGSADAVRDIDDPADPALDYATGARAAEVRVPAGEYTVRVTLWCDGEAIASGSGEVALAGTYALLVDVEGTAGACVGDRDAGTDAGPFQVAGADLCTELVRVFCEARLACCPDAMSETLEECRTDVMTECQMLVGPFVSDERTGYDPIRAGEVIVEARRLYQDDCDLGIIDLASTKEGLRSIFRGTAPMGASCSGSEPPTFLACQTPELICQSMGGEMQCLPVRALGEPCGADLACETGLYCPTGAGSTCMPQLADGQPCVDGADCQSYDCDAMGTMECMPRTRDVYCIDLSDAFQ